MIKLYMDHHVPRAVTLGLRRKDVDVVTAFEDKGHELSDPRLLSRATELGRALFSQDDDLLVEAASRQALDQTFAGVIYAHQRGISIGTCIEDLELLAKTIMPQELRNRVIYLPL